MDEMLLVRQLLDEPPPSREVITSGRERVSSQSAGAVPTTRRRRRRVGFGRALALGLTGVAAAASLAVATLGFGHASPQGAGPQTIQLSARNILLAAAITAESAPTSGAYWHVHSMARTTLPQRFGHGGFE